MPYRTYASGYYGTHTLQTKKEARAWCRKIAKGWRNMGLPRHTVTVLDSGEEHFRSETGSTLDYCGFKPANLP